MTPEAKRKAIRNIKPKFGMIPIRFDVVRVQLDVSLPALLARRFVSADDRVDPCMMLATAILPPRILAVIRMRLS